MIGIDPNHAQPHTGLLDTIGETFEGCHRPPIRDPGVGDVEQQQLTRLETPQLVGESGDRGGADRARNADQAPGPVRIIDVCHVSRREPTP